MNGYNHIILFKFKPEVDEQKAQILLQGIGMLQTRISEIEHFRYGRNDRDNGHNAGFEYAFVMEFHSKQARDRYQNHPAHQDYIQTQLEPFIEDAIVFDCAPIAIKRGV